MTKLLVGAVAALALAGFSVTAQAAGHSCGGYGQQTVSVPQPVDTAGPISKPVDDNG